MPPHPPSDLTLRQYFAACALQGLLAAKADHTYFVQTLAAEAVVCADTLLKCLKDQPYND